MGSLSVIEKISRMTSWLALSLELIQVRYWQRASVTELFFTEKSVAGYTVKGLTADPAGEPRGKNEKTEPILG
jgi:hypothetical protein